MENAQRFRARHGGKCRLDEVHADYSNLDTQLQMSLHGIVVCLYIMMQVHGIVCAVCPCACCNNQE